MTGSAGRPIRVCLQLAQYDADYGTIRRAAADAEAAGVDALFNWDHFFGPGRASEALWPRPGL